MNLKMWNEASKEILKEANFVYTPYHELNTPEFKKQFLFVYERYYCNFKKTCAACYADERDIIFLLNTDNEFRQNIKSVKIAIVEELTSRLFEKAFVDNDTKVQMFLLEKFIENSNYIDKILPNENKNDGLDISIRFV